jgi:Cytochrome bd terminal oxidase subunit I
VTPVTVAVRTHRNRIPSISKSTVMSDPNPTEPLRSRRLAESIIHTRYGIDPPAGIPSANPIQLTNSLTTSYLGSLIGSMSFTSKEVGLTDWPASDRPHVAIPFFTFRIMVGCGS